MEVRPELYVVAQTRINGGELERYLEDIECSEWGTNAPSDGEFLTEIMGRLCYRSFDPKLNLNITKVREGNKQYLSNIIKVGHGSVIEHATVSFIVTGISRVFTHELVRHRAGTAFSQESMRYVRIDNGVDWYTPKSEEGYPDLTEPMSLIQQGVKALALKLGLDQGENEAKMGMSEKKKLTSFMRRAAPIGISTTMGFTANHRAIRFMIEKRTESVAEIEIREVFDLIAFQMKERFPNLYQDMNRNDDGEWLFDSKKI